MLISLSNSDKKFTVDEIDAERVLHYTWRLKKSRKNSFYIAASTTINGKRITMYIHRFISGAPPGFDVHHKDEDTRNNKRSNLIAEEAITHRTAISIRDVKIRITKA